MNSLGATPSISFLSDIRTTAQAFEAALDTVRNHQVSKFAILGNLLTFGCKPVRTMDLMDAAFQQ